MTDTHKQRATQIVTPRRTEARSWLAWINSSFFVALAGGIAAFIYYLYFFRQLFILYLIVFLQATSVTVGISIISLIFATILGFFGAIGRLSRFSLLRWIATVYVEVVRGTPLLVQLLLWYFGVGYVLAQLGFDPYNTAFQLMTALQNNSLVPEDLTLYFYGAIALIFNYGAYLTEVFRAGIESVDKGQTEAALSLGINSGQIMRYIILPQAVRITIPPFTNNFITLIQDTALLSTIGVLELEHQTYASALPQLDVNKKLFVFVLGALFYLILCYPLALLARYLESRMKVPGSAV